jgi:hypothetical protein
MMLIAIALRWVTEDSSAPNIRIYLPVVKSVEGLHDFGLARL